ncbi:MAG TPA: JAB domain-containing protein [Rhodocyclaceae bacterium]|nr:JAB domain-containing protein [Rhodocyclaceae bacterium]
MATADCTARREREDRTIARALRILEKRARSAAKQSHILHPSDARKYLRLRLDGLEREEFWCIWLDLRYAVIETECMFVGTLTHTSVYTREVVKRALQTNAAAVMVAHNHPSGVCEPSEADRRLTRCLRDALDVVDVRLLDHFIIGRAAEPLSFAERGLL